MNYYLLYNSEDLKPISFLAEDIVDRYVPIEGQFVSKNGVELDGIPYFDQITIQADGTIIKN
jgi:hypothetical protein